MSRALCFGMMLVALLTSEPIASRAAQTATVPTDQFVGKYGCVTDDTSEISDGDRTPGHSYFDLDGDLTDKPISFTVNVMGDGRVSVQDTFAGQTSQSFSDFGIVAHVTTSDRPAIVAFRQEQFSERPIVFEMMFDANHAYYGLAITAFSATVPTMREGEAFVIVDLKTAHCRKL